MPAQHVTHCNTIFHFSLFRPELIHFDACAVQAVILCGSVKKNLSADCGCLAEGLRFDCGQYGSFTVFAVYLQFSVVVAGKWYKTYL